MYPFSASRGVSQGEDFTPFDLPFKRMDHVDAVETKLCTLQFERMTNYCGDA